MIRRHIEAAIRRDFALYAVIGITGPRQSGKTTLMKALFPDLPYTDLEDPSQQEFAVSDPRGFLGQSKGGMLIDEVQRVPGLLSSIKVVADARGMPGQFVLSGSQNLLLMERISQTLAGRISLFTLLPLSLAELYKTADHVPPLTDVLFRGFYPALYDRPFDPSRYFANYLATYVERDVRQLKQITDLGAFQRFVRLCAGRIGQVVNFSSLGDDAGVSHNTARAWLSLLETSHIVFPLRPYARNFGKQIIKMPKIYFDDTGLACALLGIGEPAAVATHYLKGGIFENFVIGELRKYLLNRAIVPSFHFWRDRRGHEVDLLVEQTGRHSAMEFKSAVTAGGSFFTGLDYYRSLDPELNASDCYVIYGGDESQDRTQGKLRSWKTLIDPVTLRV